MISTKNIRDDPEVTNEALFMHEKSIVTEPYSGPNIDDIPNDILKVFICPHLDFKDISNVIMVSKKMKLSFNFNEIWKDLFLQEKVKKFHGELIKKFAKSKVIGYDHQYHDLFYNQSTNLMIKNISCSVIFNVYFCDLNNNNKTHKMTEKPIHPGKTFFIKSLFNKKFFCVPTKEWMINNPYSNIGFSFLTKMNDIVCLPNNKNGILKYFYEPKKESLKPIQGTIKEYEDYKKELMKRKIKKEKVIKNQVQNADKLKNMQYELKMYKRQVKIMEENVARMKRKKKDYEYIYEIIK